MKIAILTNWHESRPGYGVYNVAVPEADTLSRFGNHVSLFVRTDYTQNHPLPRYKKFQIEKVIPPVSLTDYASLDQLSEDHKRYSQALADDLCTRVQNFDAVITHDWVFTGWNLPYYAALEKMSPHTKDTKFLHWVHSIPGGQRDWWNLRRLGEDNHRLVYPNSVNRLRVANFYQTDLSKVLKIPPIIDLRYLLDLGNDTLKFLEDYPEIMESQVVQVYPASTERFDAKGVRELILTFARIKDRGWTVFLLIANSHASKGEARDKLNHLIKVAKRNGLIYGEDFIFTSELEDQFREGIPKRMLSELAIFSTVFVYPSQQETFGLILPEVSMLSGSVPLINASLDVLQETAGSNGIYSHFGSYYVDWEPKDEAAWIDHIAGQVIAQLRAEEGVKTKNWSIRRYNRQTVYHRYYVPILEGSELW